MIFNSIKKEVINWKRLKRISVYKKEMDEYFYLGVVK